MGHDTTRASTSSSASYPSQIQRHISLVQPTIKRRQKKTKIVRAFRYIFRSLPILSPACTLPSCQGGKLLGDVRLVSGRSNVTGTLFGYRKGRVSFSIQENSKTMPLLVIELAMQTRVLQKEMSLGMVRIALECEKRMERDRKMLLDEPLCTMFCNGKKSGYGIRRDATEEDLQIMEVLKAVSIGVGVLEGKSQTEGADGEMAYMRTHFQHVVGSRDSETLYFQEYMLSPDGNDNGPELSIFFIRI